MLLDLALGKLAAQSGRVRRQVCAFLAPYDHAVATRDIAFLERAFLNDYVMTRTSGRKSDVAQILAFSRHMRDSPSYRVVSLKHEQVVVRTVGTMAVHHPNWWIKKYSSSTAAQSSKPAPSATLESRKKCR